MRKQDGSCGCRVAQASERMEGWAGEAMGSMGWSDGGKRLGFDGKRIGEVKFLIREESS